MKDDKSTSEGLYPQYVIDEENNKHFLSNKLGEGGQGAVFKTKDKNIVVKVVLTNPNGPIEMNEDKYIVFKNNINDVRILDLPQDIHIAKPLYMLKSPMNGYIMRLMEDMLPIKKMIICKEQNTSEFYISTGGLKKRLIILASLARTLEILHSKTIVYADISPDNIYVSSDVTNKEVWLIDSDNMRYTTDFTKPIYTPMYGAPEVVKGIANNNTLSDVYSFALLSFEVLALNKPFEGDILLQGKKFNVNAESEAVVEVEEDDWGVDEGGKTANPQMSDIEQDSSDDNYKKAEKGLIPWIEDIEDQRNKTSNGITRNIVLDKKLLSLYQQTFDKIGRADSCSRPIMSNWYYALKDASNKVTECKKCGATFYAYEKNCPFCNSLRETVYLAKIYDTFIGMDEIIEKENHLSKSLGYSDDVLIKVSDVKYDKSNIKIKVLDKKEEFQFFSNYETHDLYFDEEIINTIEIKYTGYYRIKNLLEDGLLTVVYKNGEGVKTLKSGEISDCRILEDIVLKVALSQNKIRSISFEQI
jgi:serine/threonine protein kinase